MLWWALRQLEADDPAKRIAALAKVATSQSERATLGLVRSLTDSDTKVAEAALRALLPRRDPRAIGPLISLLSNLETKCREIAKRALDELDPEWPRSFLSRLESTDLLRKLPLSKSDSREAILSALMALRDPDCVPVLVRQLRDSKESYDLVSALNELDRGWRRTPAARTEVDRLSAAVRSNAKSSRESTISLMQIICDKDDVNWIVDLLEQDLDRRRIVVCLDRLHYDWRRSKAAINLGQR